MPPQQQAPPDTQVNGMALPQMPPTKVVRYNQSSFAGGEYSPQCSARTDVEKYKTGLETCRNAYPQITGSVCNRPGFRMVAPVKNTAYPPRMVRFIYSTNQVFFIEVGNYYMRFYTQRAQVQATGSPLWVTSTDYIVGNFVIESGVSYYCVIPHTSGVFATDLANGDWVAQTAYEIPTPYAQKDLNNLRFEESADFVYIAHQNYPPMILERIGNENWQLVSYMDQVIDGPFRNENTNLASTIACVYGVSTFALDNGGDGYIVGDILTVVQGGASGGEVVVTAVSSAVASVSISVSGTGRSVNDVLAINQNGNQTALITVDSLTGSGINTFTLTNAGSGYFTQNNVQLYLYTPGYMTYVPRQGFVYVPATYTATNSYVDITAGAITAISVISMGTGYTNAAGLATTGGHGTGGTISTISAPAPNGQVPAGTVVTLQATQPIFNVGQIGALWRKTDYIQGQTVNANLTSATSTNSITCFTSWLLETNGTWTGIIVLEMSEDGGTTWTQLQSWSSVANFNVQASNTESVTTHLVPFLIRINVSAYTSGTINISLSSLPFYQDGFLRILSYISSTEVTASVLQTLGLTTNTSIWAEGAWSEFRGYPGTVRFYQDRLTWAGAPLDQADTYWMTVDGDYVSFLVSDPGEDTDGISEQLSSRQLNEINGMVAFQSLLMLTSSTSWAVQPISGSALTPSTIDQTIQDYHGSDGPDPVVIGNEAIFAEFQGKIIRSIVYNFYTQAFTSSELNPFARHLFKDWSIIMMCYQQNPDDIVWMLRSDGQLVALTYLKEQEVVGWHHHDTNGTFNSIDSAPGIGYTEVWASVTRPNGGFVEVLEDRLTKDVRESFFVDNGISNNVTVLPVTGATQASPCVITSTGHGLSSGNIVTFDSIGGMTELNGMQYSITVIDANTFSLQDVYDFTNIDSTQFGAYTSGGNCVQCFSTFTGLDYLNGQNVSILGDGFVFPQQVVSGGTLTLPRACGYVQIGMQYLSDVETLPVELSFWFNPPPPMTTQGRRVKIGGVTFGFVESRGGWIGVNVNNVYGESELEESFFPPRTNSNKVIQLYTGDLHEVIGGGWEEGARVFYRQYDPLPFTITKIIPECVVGGPTALAGGSYIDSPSGVGTITP